MQFPPASSTTQFETNVQHQSVHWIAVDKLKNMVPFSAKHFCEQKKHYIAENLRKNVNQLKDEHNIIL